jgi:hypothetical protein
MIQPALKETFASLGRISRSVIAPPQSVLVSLLPL